MNKLKKLLPPSYSEIYEKGLIHNYTIEYHEKMETNFPARVGIGDQTLRDGEQQTGVFFTPEEKLELAKMMSDVGVSTAEIAFPAVSEEEIKAAKLIAAENLKMLTFVMCRAINSDIDAALKADARAIDLFTSSSEFHIRYKLKKTPEENIEMYLNAVDYAKDHGLLIIFGREDCSRSHIDYIAKIVKAAKERGQQNFAGFAVSDTTGSLTPPAVKWFINEVKKATESTTTPPIHCHNDLNLATANTLASIEIGAPAISGTITGIGERAGNTPIEEVVVALHALYGLKTTIKDMEGLFELCKLISKYSGVPIPVNKPVIGANAFKHEAGIHAAGTLAHPYVYECIPHEWFGRKTDFRFGKFSGTAVINEFALKPNGIEVDRQQLLEITYAVKKKQIEKGKELFSKFVDEYNKIMNQMGMTTEEVVEIAKEITKK